jgi:ubiquitin C-terminal hydrolase
MCSRKELLNADNKLHCTGCNSYAEGYKWVEIAAFPPVLIIHFNRFAFTPMLEQGHKLKQRIAFPNRLVPPPDVHSCDSDDIVYELTAVVVHVGTSLAHGAHQATGNLKRRA